VGQFRLERGDEPGLFRLIGELDLSSAEQAHGRLEQELADSGRLILDTTKLDFVDSQGLRMLIALGEQAQERGTTVTVANCSDQLRRLLDMAVPKGIPGVKVLDDA
jgi:anti-sigma B factor antagonist